MGVVLLALFAVLPALQMADIRAALDLAKAPESEGRAFADGYTVRFPAAGGEQMTVELYTPFREVVERALLQRRLGNFYGELHASREFRDAAMGLRVVVRLKALTHVGFLSTGYGNAHSVSVQYQPDGASAARGALVTVIPPPSLTQLCGGIACVAGMDAAVDGAKIELFLPLAGGAGLPETALALPAIDPLGLFVVLVRDPQGRTRAARFALSDLR